MPASVAWGGDEPVPHQSATQADKNTSNYLRLFYRNKHQNEQAANSNANNTNSNLDWTSGGNSQKKVAIDQRPQHITRYQRPNTLQFSDRLSQVLQSKTLEDVIAISSKKTVTPRDKLDPILRQVACFSP